MQSQEACCRKSLPQQGSASLEVPPNLCVHDLPIDVGRSHQSVQGAGGTV